jgi:GWxTD domain-containing protein
MFRGLLVTIVFLLPGALDVFAAKSKLPERYDKWLKQEVVYIISDEERKAFLQLQTDEQREQFIRDFWETRNPNPGSTQNSYKDSIYERIEYANAHFGRMTNTPGWMTDQGRTYILFGKPDSQFNFTGYSQIYPIALWFYSNKTGSPSLPPFFSVLFFQPEGIEEYRFYHPAIDGPMKLVRGSQFNSNRDVYRFLLPLGGDLATAAFSLIPGEPIDKTAYEPNLSSEMLVSKIQNFANDHFNLEQLRTKRAMRTFVSSRMLVAAGDLNLTVLTLTDPLHEKWLDYSVPVTDEQMGFRTDDGQFAIEFRYSLLTESGALVIEDSAQRKYPAYESASAFTPFELAGRIPLVGGKYKLQVQIVNPKTDRSYRGEVMISVPTEGLESWIAGPLLADPPSRSARPNSVTPYQYYGVQFHPLGLREFAAKRKLCVLYQLYEPRPSDYDVEYVLANLTVRDARIVTTEHVQASEFSGNLLLKSKTLDTGALPPGQYMLALQLKAANGPVIASTNERLRISEGSAESPLYSVTDPSKLTSPGLVDYIRGLAALAQRDDTAAQKYLERSLKLNPANSFARQFLVQAYFHQHRYNAVSDLYRKSSLKDFEVSPEVMAQIAVSLWDSGDSGQAKTVLKSARGLFPEDSVLATADKLFSKTKN